MIRYISENVYWWDGNSQAHSDYYMYDIYNIEVSRDSGANYRQFYSFRLESKNRYSGLLYNKLRCLLSYVHYHYRDTVPAVNDRKKYLFVIKNRFYTQTMNLNYIEELKVVYNVSLLKNLYFIQS